MLVGPAPGERLCHVCIHWRPILLHILSAAGLLLRLLLRLLRLLRLVLLLPASWLLTGGGTPCGNWSCTCCGLLAGHVVSSRCDGRRWPLLGRICSGQQII